MDIAAHRIKLIAGPLIAAIAYAMMRHSGLEHGMTATAALSVWMAIWWMTEVVDLGVTSLLPFVVLPALGVMDANAVAQQYMEQTIFLFMGGFFLAFAMEKWNLHERFAYTIIQRTGFTPTRVLVGIMVTTFFISMWISNTATTLMMITAVLAIIRHEHLFDPKARQAIATGFLLALTYTASIGGLATIVGTPTNMILIGFADKAFGNTHDLNFLSWFRFGFPFALLMGLSLFIIIRYRYFKSSHNQPFDSAFIREQQDKLGFMRYEEKAVLTIFVITVLLWFTRSSIDFGSFTLNGWSTYFAFGKMIKDSTIAIGAAVLLFLWPARDAKSESLLNWSDVTKLPFRVILLFGSGFAIAAAYQESGLATFLAKKLEHFAGMPVWVFTLGIALLVTVLSEFASNVASIQLMLPILAPVAVSLHVPPMTLMIPATIAASFGFMMPVATAPNTIVYGTGMVPVKEMMRTGLLLNIIGILLLSLYTYLFEKLA